MTTHPLSIVARVVELLVGLFFIVSAIMKLLDVDLFVVQIGAYGIFEDKQLLLMSAIGTLFLEFFLGSLLVLGFTHRWLSIGLTLLLLVFFTGLVGYGWAFQDLSECGCFGAIEMSPLVTTLKNLVLMAMGLFAWWGITLTPSHIAMPRLLPITPGMNALLSLAIALLATVYGYLSVEQMEVVRDESGAERPFARFVFEDEEGTIDLGAGEHLVVFLSTDCLHCKAEVPTLNDIAFDPELPEMVGLAFEDSDSGMLRFEMDAMPVFPLFSLGDQVMLFFNFIGQAPPRLYYVVDGQAVEYWDFDMPTAEEVRTALE